MFMPSSKIESAVFLRNNITLSLESVDLKMAPVCSQRKNQQWLKPVVWQTLVGQSVGEHVQRENLSHQNYTNVFNILYYCQDGFLISAIFWNTLIFCFLRGKKEKLSEPSLVVQWLRFHASNAVGIGSIPSQGTKIQHPVWYIAKKKKKVECIQAQPTAPGLLIQFSGIKLKSSGSYKLH